MIGKPSGLIAYLEELQDQHDELAEKLREEQAALQRKYESLWGEFAKRTWRLRSIQGVI